ncbi:ribonuclease Z [Candidatus Pacearchaeota archaeon]|nr:ribonuclease Z [Candidatus Pacearchaeota archaeon]
MEIIFLGTSEATPTAEKNQTSIYLKYGSEKILIDVGENTQRQMKIAKINPCSITRILITHWHGDHILGLPGLLQTLALNNYSQTLKIYGPRGSKKHLDILLKAFIFEGKLKVEIYEVGNKIIVNEKDFFIESREMSHGTPCIAYSFTEKDKRKIDLDKIKKLQIPNGPLIGQLQQGKSIRLKGKTIKPNLVSTNVKGRKISVILDTEINENCYKLAKDSNLLICEATFSKDLKDRAKERKHLTADQTAMIAKKSKSKKLMILHISQRYNKKEEIILNEVKKIFPNSELARDFMKIEL